MILKYYNGFVSHEKLISMTKTTIKGTDAYHLTDALINLGFDCKGVSCTLEDLNKDNIILPAIANVTIDNSFKHFIVIYEINFNKKYLIIGDPADKVKKIKFDEFKKIFNNVLLLFYPIKNIPIEQIKDNKVLIKELIKPQKKEFINIIILSIFITLLSILTTFYTKYMINGISAYSNSHLTFIFCIFFSIYILKMITEYFRNVSFSYINQYLDLVLTLDVMKNIIKLPYYYYKNKTTGDILSRINDIDNIKDTISTFILSLFIDLPLTFVSCIVLFYLSHELFFVGIIILMLYFLIIILFRGLFNDYIKRIKQKKSDSTSYMVEVVGGYETIKNIRISDDIMTNLEKKCVKASKDMYKYQKLFFLQTLFKEIINNIGSITIIFIGSSLVIKGKLSLGTLLTFSSLLLYFLEPIKSIINLDTKIKESKISLNRLSEILLTDKEKVGIIKEMDNGDIVFKNLTYTFDDRNNVLQNINFKIKKSSNVMIVGKSGSGKSTLFKLLLKYYKIDRNKIYINNIDINDYDKEIINKNIIYISQNEILFNDTIYNNLCFNGSNSSKILDYSKMCCVDEILDSNLGFNKLIEENGFNISGGEKQRLILLRGILKNFEILIIDEGLNQVDPIVERKILSNLFLEFKNKTIIFISHRLDNKDLFDDVVEIKNGEVILNG